MKFSVWLPADENKDLVEALRDGLDDEVRLLVGPDLPEGAEPRVLVRGVPSREQLDACPRLERLVIPYAGVPAPTRTLMLENPQVKVHNLHHNAAPGAEMAVTLLLALAKELVPHDRALRRGDWTRRYRRPTTTTLAGRTALILGYGAIGRRVAHALKALGMRVLAVRRRAPQMQMDQGVEIHATEAMRSLLPRADALMICLPLTPLTVGCIGATEFELLPPSAYVVNMGRGALVEESALYEALSDRRIGGAGLDVWYQYPGGEEERAQTPPSKLPFGELDNVVMSPHRGGLTRETETLRAHALVTLLNAAAVGDPVDNAVDLEAGY